MKKTQQQPPVVFRANWFEAIENMPLEYHTAVYKAIMRYAFLGEMPSDPMVMGLASMIFQLIDGDRERYKQVSDSRSQSAKKRWHKAEACNCISSDASDANTNTITNTKTNTNTNDYVDKEGVDVGVSAQQVLDDFLAADKLERVNVKWNKRKKCRDAACPVRSNSLYIKTCMRTRQVASLHSYGHSRRLVDVAVSAQSARPKYKPVLSHSQ